MIQRLKAVLVQWYIVARMPLIWLAAAVLRRWCRIPDPRAAEILIIRLDRLGDFVLTLPVIENIKKHDPGARVSVLVRPQLSALASSIGMIDEVITYDGFFRTVRRLRQQRYTVAIDMLSDYRLKPALGALCSGAPERIGFAGGFRELLFTRPVRAKQGGRPMSEVNLDLLAPLGVPAVERVPRLTLKGGNPGRGMTVALHPGSYYPSQRWPAGRFAAVAAQIAQKYDVDILVIGGRGERELVDAIMGRLGQARATAIFPDSRELAFAVARSAMLICNNSGPLHLAAALGTPTVSMMGPTDPALWWPQGLGHIVIRKDLPCAGCGKGVCADHRCMTDISVDEVFTAACGILDKTDGISKRY